MVDGTPAGSIGVIQSKTASSTIANATATPKPTPSYEGKNGGDKSFLQRNALRVP
jgi:hypothetical protein